LPFVVIALLLGLGWVVFQLTLFLSKCANTGMLHSLLTPVLSCLPILWFFIE
jgi:hypothetical protein